MHVTPFGNIVIGQSSCGDGVAVPQAVWPNSPVIVVSMMVLRSSVLTGDSPSGKHDSASIAVV